MTLTGEHKYWRKTYPSASLLAINPTGTDLESNLVLRGDRNAAIAK